MEKKVMYGVAGIVLGLILLIWSCGWAESGTDALDWPTAEGMIMQSSVVSYGKRLGKKYEYLISYNYKVDGKTYTSDKVRSGWFISRKENAFDDLLEKYNKYDRVQVFYNPRDPSKAVLEPGENERTGSSLSGFALVIIVLSITYLVLNRRIH